MSASEQLRQHAWGKTSQATSQVWTPSHVDDAQAVLLSASTRGVIARGYGRSYGDACLNDGGGVINTNALNAIRSFDETTGVLCCDAGVSYATIMERCLPLGWLPPVCPGTAWVSMGGAIANDVHGKNQHTAGTFGDHVDWFDLLTGDGQVTRVTRDSDDELFDATVGGIGLTGVIIALQFRLQRVPSNAFDMSETRVPNLDAFLERLSVAGHPGEYTVGWIDCLTSGRHMGRGVLETARAAAHSVTEQPRTQLKV
ncbi:MAG: FAD-binding oxidoreductase, partial [Gemmatimonadota bacterium]|nr:FAD-binding oxidoreductase [Gemmatimonadota bacterium]